MEHMKSFPAHPLESCMDDDGVVGPGDKSRRLDNVLTRSIGFFSLPTPSSTSLATSCTGDQKGNIQRNIIDLDRYIKTSYWFWMNPNNHNHGPTMKPIDLASCSLSGSSSSGVFPSRLVFFFSGLSPVGPALPRLSSGFLAAIFWRLSPACAAESFGFLFEWSLPFLEASFSML